MSTHIDLYSDVLQIVDTATDDVIIEIPTVAADTLDETVRRSLYAHVGVVGARQFAQLPTTDCREIR
jgi:hypothetical protein